MYENNKIDFVKKFCFENEIFFQSNFDLGNNSYSRTGGSVKIALFPDSLTKIIKIHEVLKDIGVEFKIVGESTNILFLDSVEYSCFVFTKFLTSIQIFDDYVEVECGRLVSDFVRDLAMRGYSGIEGLEGIPGTIGGALVMNAGAYGFAISDTLLQALVINSAGKIQYFSVAELTIKNRSIIEFRKSTILKARFKLTAGEQADIERRVRRFHISRHQYQEWVYPNLGSIFIVPSLNINEDMREIYACRPFWLRFTFRFAFKLWFSKPFFLIRRSFPDFNVPFKLLSRINVKPYSHPMASKATVNTFANKGSKSIEILEYFSELYESSKRRYEIENEIFCENIYKVVKEQEFEKSLEIRAELLEKQK